jgi:DTW domain-containing protein
MNLQDYLKLKEELKEKQPRYRSLCTSCMQPAFSCYCHHIQKVNCQIEFIILIHPIEVKRRIATGRMSQLCLENSKLIKGEDFAENAQVNAILADQDSQCVILYPGKNAQNLSVMSEEQKNLNFSQSKKLVVFVIDGTWATAGKMIRRSPNLLKLPKICFVPKGLSQFRVRKQPAPECFSTIEAIHQTIELLGLQRGFQVSGREHDRLLYVFNQMVEKQLTFVREAYDHPRLRAYRRPKFRVA